MEPVGRLLANINDQIYDRIVDILKISKTRVKHLKYGMFLWVGNCLGRRYRCLIHLARLLATI